MQVSFVVVSRAIALPKVSLIGDLKGDMIKASKTALLEYDMLRRYSNLFSAFENSTKIF